MGDLLTFHASEVSVISLSFGASGSQQKKRDVQRGLRKKQQKWINKRFVCAAFLLETHSIIYQWR